MCDSCGGLWCSPLLWGWWCAIHVGACGVRFLWGLVLCDFLWGLGVCDSLWEFVVCDSCGGRLRQDKSFFRVLAVCGSFWGLWRVIKVAQATSITSIRSGTWRL